MLHILYPQLAEQLRTAVPALGTIDLDMAQLDFQSQEPIAYPAVFIDVENIDWQDLGQGVQTGKVLLRVTVATEVSEETQQGSGQVQSVVERLLVVQQVHQALQHFQGQSFGALVRTNYRRDRPQHPEAWCMAMGYVTELYDNDGALQLQGSADNVAMATHPGRRPAPVPEEGSYVLPTA